MFDALLRPVIDKPLNLAARQIVKTNLSANAITWVGFFIGMGAAIAIAHGSFVLGLLLIAVNRIFDGLDGAVARLRGPTDFGGYLDIVLDFLFYSSIPFAFVAYDQTINGVAGAFLIFSFMGTGSSFLAYAIMAEKHKVTTDIRGRKSFYYLGGLTEGTETIVAFFVFCLWPEQFYWLALIFGMLCWLTTSIRILAAKNAFN
ncbi:CDP-alcohol phosphatidyltransferase family protein [Curvivirga aplysinae]|uniref:CDP-alcohol phosphatidyltransferase family protein n=1 Tax=Curvivirga aplysinae TaxID=2529852 RepID=UPI0012BBA1D3|nr:CDP-alcohol phosphatidyltransferase family protein [Curvivirga aplysinae]MTI10016.1 CDP-alcohol phosphatidyltransferase family protein [Curvivirga aplysinae]